MLLGMGNLALYALPYTLSKTRSEVNTWVGAVVGAVPPMMGWAAATNCSVEALLTYVRTDRSTDQSRQQASKQARPALAHSLTHSLTHSRAHPTPKTSTPEPLLLAAGLFLWQFPHFFALSWVHRRDYARGGFAMVPCADPSGVRTADLILRCVSFICGVFPGSPLRMLIEEAYANFIIDYPT